MKGIKNFKKKKASSEQNEELTRCADGFLIPKKIKKEENGESTDLLKEKDKE